MKKRILALALALSMALPGLPAAAADGEPSLTLNGSTLTVNYTETDTTGTDQLQISDAANDVVGEYPLANGPGSAVTVSGLTPGMLYTLNVYEKDANDEWVDIHHLGNFLANEDGTLAPAPEEPIYIDNDLVHGWRLILTTGTSKSYSFSVDEEWYTGVTWELVGTLPAGLTFTSSGNTAGISGTATTTNRTPLTLHVQGTDRVTGEPFSAVLGMGLEVYSPLTITGPETITFNQTDTSSYTFTASGADSLTDFSWGIKVGGEWGFEEPDDQRTVKLSGKLSPDALSGTIATTVFVEAWDDYGNSYYGERPVTIQMDGNDVAIYGFSGVVFTPGVEDTYDYTIDKDLADVQWSLEGGSLPDGLSLTQNGATASITGTPAAKTDGPIFLTLRAQGRDAGGNILTGSYPITVAAVDPVAIEGPEAITFNQTEESRYTFSISEADISGKNLADFFWMVDGWQSWEPNDPNDESCTLTGPLPPGEPSGTLQATVSVTALDGDGTPYYGKKTVTVQLEGKDIALTGPDTLNFTAGQSASYDFHFTGDNLTGFHWFTDPPTLPDGLSLAQNGATASISGTPASATTTQLILAAIAEDEGSGRVYSLIKDLAIIVSEPSTGEDSDDAAGEGGGIWDGDGSTDEPGKPGWDGDDATGEGGGIWDGDGSTGTGGAAPRPGSSRGRDDDDDDDDDDTSIIAGSSFSSGRAALFGSATLGNVKATTLNTTAKVTGGKTLLGKVSPIAANTALGKAIENKQPLVLQAIVPENVDLSKITAVTWQVPAAVLRQARQAGIDVYCVVSPARANSNFWAGVGNIITGTAEADLPSWYASANGFVLAHPNPDSATLLAEGTAAQYTYPTPSADNANWQDTAFTGWSALLPQAE